MSVNILCPNCNTPGMEDIDSEIFLCRTCVQIWGIEPDGSHIRCYSLHDDAYLEIECPICTSRLVDIGTGGEGVCLTCAKVRDVTSESLSVIEEIKENKIFLDRVEYYRKKIDVKLSNNNEVFEQCIQEILKADRADALKLYELNALLTAKRS